jgi:hypothetical protein
MPVFKLSILTAWLSLTNKSPPSDHPLKVLKTIPIGRLKRALLKAPSTLPGSVAPDNVETLAELKTMRRII